MNVACVHFQFEVLLWELVKLFQFLIRTDIVLPGPEEWEGVCVSSKLHTCVANWKMLKCRNGITEMEVWNRKYRNESAELLTRSEIYILFLTDMAHATATTNHGTSNCYYQSRHSYLYLEL